MVHAEKLMERLLFLEAPITYLKHGAPVALTDVEAMFKADMELEIAAIQRLAAGIKACEVAGRLRHPAPLGGHPHRRGAPLRRPPAPPRPLQDARRAVPAGARLETPPARG